jgi:hypothetical protein
VNRAEQEYHDQLLDRAVETEPGPDEPERCSCDEALALRAQLAQARQILASFDARKPLPAMSQVATAALALNHCLDTIDALREALGEG